MFLFNTR